MDIRLIVESAAERLLASGTVRGSRLEVMDGFAIPMALDVIARVLGLAGASLEPLAHWSRQIVDSMDAGYRPETVAAGLAAREALNERLRAELDRLARDPDDGALSSIIAAGALDEAELVNTSRVLLHSGFASTAALLGGAVLALVEDGTARDRLAADPGLWPLAAEELIRFCSPIQSITRFALRTVRLGGRRVERGDVVTVLLGAANRDPARFPDPDLMRLDRSPNPHLGFGHGLHACLGAWLARIEVQVGVRLLLDGCAAPRVVDGPVWRRNATIRSLDRLVISLS